MLLVSALAGSYSRISSRQPNQPIRIRNINSAYSDAHVSPRLHVRSRACFSGLHQLMISSLWFQGNVPRVDALTAQVLSQLDH